MGLYWAFSASLRLLHSLPAAAMASFVTSCGIQTAHNQYLSASSTNTCQGRPGRAADAAQQMQNLLGLMIHVWQRCLHALTPRSCLMIGSRSFTNTCTPSCKLLGCCNIQYSAACTRPGTEAVAHWHEPEQAVQLPTMAGRGTMREFACHSLTL